MSLLSISSLKAYYGESQALFDVNLEINEGEIVALMGRNGTGKSTTVKSIFQMIETNGELLFSGKNLNGSMKIDPSGFIRIDVFDTKFDFKGFNSLNSDNMSA